MKVAHRTPRLLDSVTFQSPYGRTLTIREDIPVEWDGFYWRVMATQRERVSGTEGDVAVGERDGQTVARGFVEHVDYTPDGNAQVIVGPPDKGEVDSLFDNTDWL